MEIIRNSNGQFVQGHPGRPKGAKGKPKVIYGLSAEDIKLIAKAVIDEINLRVK